MSGRRTMTILLLAALLAPGVLAAGTSWVEGSVETSDRVLVEGSTLAEIPEGVVHLRTSADEDVTLLLEAASATVTTTWERGYRAAAIGKELVRLTEPYSSGVDEARYDDVTAVLAASEAQPEVLAILGPGASATGHAQRVAYLRALEDRYITQVEYSEGAQTVGDGPRPSFWYKVDGTQVSASGLVGAAVTGDFDLFVNNVTLAVEGRDGAGEHWGGYREEAAASPASRFETRVTVISVRDGRLTLGTSDALSLIGSPVSVHMNGTASANRVQGVLNAPDLRYAYEDSRLELTGDGALTVLPGTAAEASDPLLRLHPEGRYAIHRTPGVVVAPLPTEGPGEVDWLWASGGILAIFAAAALLGARTRILAAVDTWRATWAERSIATWMSTGDRLRQVRDFEGAARWYRRVARKHAHYVEAWYSLGAALTELERFDEAAAAYAQANKLLGGDDPELLDLAATARWHAGERSKATELFLVLARVDPERVRRRLRDDELSALRGDDRLTRALAMPEDASASYV